MIMNYFLPLSLMITFYAKIAWVLHKMTKVNEAFTKQEIKVDKESYISAKANSTVLISVIKLYMISGHIVASDNLGGADTSDRKLNDVQDSKIDKVAKRNEIKQSEKSFVANARDGVLKTSFWIGICYISCYTVNQIFYFLATLGRVPMGSGNYSRLTLAVLHCCINPIIYSAKLDLFRQGIVWYFKVKIKKRRLAI